MFSGHLPSTNTFTLATPTAKTYIASETLTFSVSFPFDIILDSTSGTPRLKLTIGSDIRYATNVPQADPKKLIFTYTFIAGDNDSNGIDVNALELNGSTLKFDNNGVLTDCNVGTLTYKNFPTVKVDNAGPVPDQFKIVNPAFLYNKDADIVFTLRFTEPVYVTGTPTFQTQLGTGNKTTSYINGSGTNTLSFSFKVARTDNDVTGGFNFDGVLTGGTIKDASGNDASLDFSSIKGTAVTASTGVHIGGYYPHVVDVIVPTDGTYQAGDTLDFVVQFDREINVTAVPYISIVIGANTRAANYVSGHGTDTLTFRYTAVPGDVSTGITVATMITQDTGSNIRDKLAPTTSYFLAGADGTISMSYIVPPTSGIILNAIQPQVTSVSRNLDSSLSTANAVDNTWIIGQQLLITLNFNTPMYVTQTNGIPTVEMTIGSSTLEASYLSGGNGSTSLVFSYTILEGQEDIDGITLNTIKLNNGVIVDAENTNTLLTIPTGASGIPLTKVDAIKPVLNEVTAPTNETYSTYAPYTYAQMIFTAKWSEPVNVSGATNTSYISIDIGGTSRNAIRLATNNIANIQYRPGTTDLNGLNDTDGISIASTLAGAALVKDLAGNSAAAITFTPPDTTGIKVDTTAPTVSGMSPITGDGTYGTGAIEFTVNFSEPVTIVSAGGFPNIPMEINTGGTKALTYVSGALSTYTFGYNINAGDGDPDGIQVNASFNNNDTTAYARDAGRNPVSGFGLVPAPVTPGIKIDTTKPSITNATTPVTSRSYVSGEVLSISVIYSEPVFVDTTDGDPTIAVNFDQGTDNFDFDPTSSGTNTLVFKRTLTGSHFDMTGLPSSINTITPNGAIIEDAAGNTVASNSFAAYPINLSTTYVTYPEVRLWLKNDFVNKAPPGGVVVNIAGSNSTEACGASNSSVCRTFDGDDSLTLNAASSFDSLTNVLMAFKTPGSIIPSRTSDIFSSHVVLDDDNSTTSFDISTSAASMNGGALLSNHNIDIPLSTTFVMQLSFSPAVSIPGNAQLIENNFGGAIGEIIAIDGALGAPELANIKSYLDGNFD